MWMCDPLLLKQFPTPGKLSKIKWTINNPDYVPEQLKLYVWKTHFALKGCSLLYVAEDEKSSEVDGAIFNLAKRDHQHDVSAK